MARFDIIGLEELEKSFAKLAELPEGIIQDMTLAGADILMNGQMCEGLAMGVIDTGETLRSLNVRKEKKGASLVEFKGKNSDGNRNAEVAFVNNYGTEKQKERPFIETANTKYEPQMTQAEEQIYNKWLTGLGL